MCHYSLRIILFTLLFCHATITLARQVEGRITLPSDCTADEHWVRDHSKNTGQWTSFCRKNENGLSQPKGFRFWAPRFRPDRPHDWPWSQEKSTSWTPSEAAAVLSSLRRIPENLWLGHLKGIYRIKKCKDDLNPASSGNGNIVLYDLAFQKNFDLTRLLSHELAHEKFRSLSDEERLDYAYSTGWGSYKSKNGERIYLPRACCYVDPDGKSSLAEDFYNNIDYFLFDSKNLKSTTPQASSWIQKHFGANFKIGGPNVVK